MARLATDLGVVEGGDPTPLGQDCCDGSWPSKRGEEGGGSVEAQRSVTWPQCPAGASLHDPPPATCWTTIWGSGKPHKSIIFLVAGMNNNKSQEICQPNLEREVGGGTAAACCLVRICCLMKCLHLTSDRIFLIHLIYVISPLL